LLQEPLAGNDRSLEATMTTKGHWLAVIAVGHLAACTTASPPPVAAAAQAAGLGSDAIELPEQHIVAPAPGPALWLGEPTLSATRSPGEPAPVLVALRLPPTATQQEVAPVQRAVAAAVPGFQVGHRYARVPALAGWATTEVRSQLAQHPMVAAVTDDREVGVQMAPAALVQATQVQKSFGLTGQGVRVAVVDSGVDAGHPDLKGRVVAQRCVGSCPQGPWLAPDEHGHGTHIAGLIAGQGKLSPAGMAPAAELVAVRVFGKSGQGSMSNVVAGLDWLAGLSPQQRVDVVNLSLGSNATYTTTCNAAEPVLAAAVQLLQAKGAIVVAAAGNGGQPAAMAAPACISGVVSVAAAYTSAYGKQTWSGLCSDAKTSVGQLVCVSNRSKATTLLAPGAFLTSAAPGGTTSVRAGTSQATAVTSGSLALLRECNPGATTTVLVTALRQGGLPVGVPPPVPGGKGSSLPLLQLLPAVKQVCPLGPWATARPALRAAVG
jgi:subtilisin family serine protease